MLGPFPINGYRGIDSFCNRNAELERLTLNAAGHVNTTLVSYRRMGKTALLFRFFDSLSRRSYMPVFADVEATHTMTQFNNALASAIARAMQSPRGTMGKTVTDLMQRLRANISVDPITMQPSVQFSFGTGSPPAERGLDELLKILEEQPKRVVLAIDEFQQVSQYTEGSVESLLRSRFQHLKNVSFVFSGSNKQMMSAMFADAKRPFYHSTSMLGLREIADDHWRAYISQQFSSTGRRISDAVITSILEVTYRHTFYVQLLCNRLWSTGEKRLTDTSLVDASLAAMTRETEVEFFSYRQLLGTVQWNVLTAIGREGIVTEPTSAGFIQRNRLTSSAAITKALHTLINKELVLRNDDGSYRVYNPFFAWWAKHRIPV